MGKTAFISVSLKNREAVDEQLNCIVDVLHELGFESNVFVDNFAFEMDEADEMMAVACADIAESDLVIAEVSHKAIGVGVEVGYAIGVGKPVIYVRHVEAEHSTTVGGIATHTIVYDSVEDLAEKLKTVLRST